MQGVSSSPPLPIPYWHFLHCHMHTSKSKATNKSGIITILTPQA